MAHLQKLKQKYRRDLGEAGEDPLKLTPTQPEVGNNQEDPRPTETSQGNLAPAATAMVPAPAMVPALPNAALSAQAQAAALVASVMQNAVAPNPQQGQPEQPQVNQQALSKYSHYTISCVSLYNILAVATGCHYTKIPPLFGFQHKWSNCSART